MPLVKSTRIDETFAHLPKIIFAMVECDSYVALRYLYVLLLDHTIGTPLVERQDLDSLKKAKELFEQATQHLRGFTGTTFLFYLVGGPKI